MWQIVVVTLTTAQHEAIALSLMEAFPLGIRAPTSGYEQESEAHFGANFACVATVEGSAKDVTERVLRAFLRRNVQFLAIVAFSDREWSVTSGDVPRGAKTEGQYRDPPKPETN